MTTWPFTSGSREDQFKADVSGMSTLTPVDVETEVNSALNAYNAATSTDVQSSRNQIIADIAALNNFDPANDVVARVTLVDTTTDLTNQSGGGSGGDATAANQSVIISAINDLNNFDPDSDVVANVQTVQTVISGGGGGGGGGSITVKAAPTPRAF